VSSKSSANVSGSKRIAVIPGDGIGTEVTREAVKVLKAVTSGSRTKLDFTEFDWGAERYLRDGTTLPPDAAPMLRRDFEQHPVHWNEHQVVITASFGITEIVSGEGHVTDIIGRVDAALYQAKQAGRNRVSVAEAVRELSAAQRA